MAKIWIGKQRRFSSTTHITLLDSCVSSLIEPLINRIFEVARVQTVPRPARPARSRLKSKVNLIRQHQIRFIPLHIDPWLVSRSQKSFLLVCCYVLDVVVTVWVCLVPKYARSKLTLEE